MRSKRNKSRTQSKPKGEPHLQGAAAADAGGYVAETDSFPDNPPPHEASSAMAGGMAAASASTPAARSSRLAAGLRFTSSTWLLGLKSGESSTAPLS